MSTNLTDIIISTMATLPAPGSRLPKKTAFAAQKRKDSACSPKKVSGDSKKASNQHNIPKSKGATPQTQRKRPGQPAPVSRATSSGSAAQAKSAKTSTREIGTTPEAMSSSQVVSSSTKPNNSNEASVLSKLLVENSQYNGPQLVEPCVANALFHILQPCGHRVMTRDVQLCGQNCEGSDSAFVNEKTRAKFACAVCISWYVHEHYRAKMGFFRASLVILEEAMGGFRDGWEEKRIGRMERVWKNDALEEQRALEKLGRRCEAVSSDPDEEIIVDDEEKAKLDVRAPTEVQSPTTSCAETKMDRLRGPMAKQSKGASQPSALSSTVVDDPLAEFF
jgi:hypothetical protein